MLQDIHQICLAKCSWQYSLQVVFRTESSSLVNWVKSHLYIFRSLQPSLQWPCTIIEALQVFLRFFFQTAIAREGSIHFGNYESIKFQNVILRKLHLNLNVFDSWLWCLQPWFKWCSLPDPLPERCFVARLKKWRIQNVGSRSIESKRIDSGRFDDVSISNATNPYLDFIGIMARRIGAIRSGWRRSDSKHFMGIKSIGVYIAVLSAQSVV